MNEDLSKLDLIELLDLVTPISEPQAVSLWPQAAGWIWLGLALVALAGWLVRRRTQRRRAGAYRRAALEEIRRSGRDPVALAGILRRTALAAYPRGEVAGLYGEAWLAFLDEAVGGAQFREGAGRALAAAPYAREQVVAEELETLTVDWVRRHRAAEVAAP